MLMEGFFLQAGEDKLQKKTNSQAKLYERQADDYRISSVVRSV